MRMLRERLGLGGVIVCVSLPSEIVFNNNIDDIVTRRLTIKGVYE